MKSRARHLDRSGRSKSLHLALIAVSVAGFAAIVFTSYPTPGSGKPAFTSPRHNVNYELAQRMSEGLRPAIKVDAFDRLPSDLAIALTPRDASLLNGEVVPREFPAVIAFQAVLHRINSSLVPRLALLLAVLAAFLVADTIRLVTRRSWPAWFGTLLFVGSVPFFAVTMRPTAADMGSVVGLVGGLWAALRAQRPDDRPDWISFAWGILSGLLLGFAVATRYTNAVLVALLVLAVAGSLRRQKSIVFGIGTGGLIVLAALLAYHNWVYGGPLATGYAISQDLVSQTVNPTRAWPFGFDQSVFWSHARLYLLRPDMLWILMLGLLGGIAAFRWPVPRLLRAAVVPILGFAVVIILYQGGRNTYGSMSHVANASFTRYLLPVLALSAILAAVFVVTRRASVRLFVVLGSLAAVSIAVYHLNTAEGGFDVTDSVNNLEIMRDHVISATEPESLIITRSADKVLWPERSTLTASYLVNNPEPIDLGADRFYWQIPPADRLADVLVSLCAHGENVYLLNEGGWLPQDEFAELAASLVTDGIGLTTTIPDLRADLFSVSCP